MRLPLAHGANLNHVDEQYDMTPLSQAMLSFQFKISRKLVEIGADPNQRLGDGDTVLHRVVRHQRTVGLQAVELSFELGGDPTLRNDDGQTPVDLARDLPTTKYGSRIKTGDRLNFLQFDGHL